jgi:hypothetical protein
MRFGIRRRCPLSNPRVKIVSILVVTIMTATAVAAMADLSPGDVELILPDPVIVLSDNFDDGSISDWVTDSSGGLVLLSTNHYVSPRYSLGLEKYPAKKVCSASHALGSLPNTNQRLYLDVDMMSRNSGGDTDLYLNLMSGNREMLTLAFHWSCVSWFDGYWHSICTFSPSSAGNGDMWYHVKIVADMSSGSFDIYVTGENPAHSGTALGVPFRSPTHTIDTVCFQAGWNSMASTGGEAFWVDDLVIKA